MKTDAQEKGRLLLVDDDKNVLKVLKVRLASQGYAVEAVESPNKALSLFEREAFDVVVTDLKMAPMDGISLLKAIKELSPQSAVIVLTAYGSIETAVEATRQGAYDYLAKPYDPKELVLKIERAIETRRLEARVEHLQDLLRDHYGTGSLLTRSDKMKRVLDKALQAAATDASVAIYGESGVGKELIAKIVHLNSRRVDGPFVVVNCGAFPEGLLENELFGHVKGAFTGANENKEGFLGKANKGTLFLDEIAELPLDLQPKLLRVLQEGEYYPVGSTTVKKVDFRLITATNKDLKAEVEKGTFREDLFYRVHVIPIHILPLRERKEDIPLLVENFIKAVAQKQEKRVEGITPDALHRLMLYEWPGNVRELKNIIEYAVTMTRKTKVDIEDLFPLQAEEEAAPFPTYNDARQSFERAYVVQVLKLANGNVSKAASLANKARAEFYRIMARVGVNPDDYKM
ncbi:MAG: sigma-54 dependent transcriptional regulator [Nitrospirota bacterium]|nr:sigma-54 dependent transcriptional regulator [Nitrospirota bacterium]